MLLAGAEDGRPRSPALSERLEMTVERKPLASRRARTRSGCMRSDQVKRSSSDEFSGPGGACTLG